jgi:peptidoglycan/LPS O-acetylase OafA/YrhL
LLLNLAACAALTAVARSEAAYITYSSFAEFNMAPLHALWLTALTDRSTRPAAAASCRGPSRALLASPPLRALGSVAYALYCLHAPLCAWAAWAAHGGTSSSAPHPLPLWALPPLLAGCLLVAALAHAYVEKPLRLRLRGAGSE